MSESIGIGQLVLFMEEAFREGKTATLVASGRSMTPLLHHGIDSVILGECKNPEKLKRLDIPLYRRPDGKYVLHRIVKVHKDSFDMCGDAQIKIERNVPKTAVVAQAVGFIRNGKEFSVTSPKYRLYSFLWCSVIPLRGLAFKLNYKLRGRKSK